LCGRIHYIQLSIYPQRSVHYFVTQFCYSHVSSELPVTVSSTVTMKTKLTKDTNVSQCLCYCRTTRKSV